MTLKGTCIGAALGALVAGASWALRPADEGTAVAVVASESRDSTQANVDGALAGASAPTSSATRSVAAVEGELALDSLFGVVCHGRVIDAAGAGVAGARLALEDLTGALTSVTSDDAGGWSTFGLAPGTYELDVRADAHLTWRSEVEVRAAREWRHDIVLTAAPTLPVRFEDLSGVPLADGGLGSSAQYLGVAASQRQPGARLLSPGRAVHGSEAARYRSRTARNAPPDLGERYQGALQLTESPPLWVAAAYRDVVLEARRIDGRVVDGSGAPLAIPLRASRPELCAGPGDLELRVSGRANAEGVTSVSWLAPGEVLLQAGGHDGRARVARLVDTAREARIELVVPTGTEVVVKGQVAARGRVYVLYDAAGQVLYGDSTVPLRFGLAPGAYTLVRIDDGRESMRRTFTVGDARTVVRIGED